MRKPLICSYNLRELTLNLYPNLLLRSKRKCSLSLGIFSRDTLFQLPLQNNCHFAGILFYSQYNHTLSKWAIFVNNMGQLLPTWAIFPKTAPKPSCNHYEYPTRGGNSWLLSDITTIPQTARPYMEAAPWANNPDDSGYAGPFSNCSLRLSAIASRIGCRGRLGG